MLEVAPLAIDVIVGNYIGYCFPNACNDWIFCVHVLTMIQCGFGTWILIANTKKIKFIALCWFTHGLGGDINKKM
jgi:hypothetical protein